MGTNDGLTSGKIIPEYSDMHSITSFLINGSPPARSINDTPISSASEKILFQDSFVSCPLSILSEHSRTCYILPSERQLFKLAKNTNAKKEDDEVYFEDNQEG